MKRYFIFMVIILFFIFPAFVYSQDSYASELKELDLLAQEERWYVAHTLFSEMIILYPGCAKELRDKYSYVTEKYRRLLDAELLYDVNLMFDGYKKGVAVYDIKKIEMSAYGENVDSFDVHITVVIENGKAFLGSSGYEEGASLNVIENFLKLSNEFISERETEISEESKDIISTGELQGTLRFEYEYLGEEMVSEYYINPAVLKDYKFYLLYSYLSKWAGPSL